MLRKGTAQEIPHALTDIPEYAAATQKLNELHGKQTELQSNAAKLHELLSGDTSRPNAVITAKAQALIAGRSDKLERLAALRGELERTEEDLAVVTEAIRLQQDVLETERVRVNRLIVQAIVPEHKQLAGRIAAALKQLTAALDDEQRFRDALEAGGVRGVCSVGFDDVFTDRIERWFKETAELNYA